jgi:hypothetical protein
LPDGLVQPAERSVMPLVPLASPGPQVGPAALLAVPSPVEVAPLVEVARRAAVERAVQRAAPQRCLPHPD